MRMITTLGLALLLPGAALAKGNAIEPAAHYETNTYRQGSTMSSQRGTTPEACSAACSAEAMCAAWTLTPATFRIGPRCELKRSPGRSVTRPGAVSGLSAAILDAPQARAPKPEAPVDETPELAGGVDTPVPAVAEAVPPAPQPVAAALAPSGPAAPTHDPAAPAREASQPPRPAVVQANLPAREPAVTLPAPPAGLAEPAPDPLRAQVSGTVVTPPPMSPRPTTGSDNRPALPLRKQQEGVPSYSVQRMDLLPGDYEGTAGMYDAEAAAEEADS